MVNKIASGVLFEVADIIGKKIRTITKWQKYITAHKHPEIKGKEEEVKLALTNPDEVRASRDKVYIRVLPS